MSRWPLFTAILASVLSSSFGALVMAAEPAPLPGLAQPWAPVHGPELVNTRTKDPQNPAKGRKSHSLCEDVECMSHHQGIAGTAISEQVSHLSRAHELESEEAPMRQTAEYKACTDI